MIRVLELRSVRGTGGGPEKTILFGAQRHDRGRFAITVCYIRDARDDVFGIDARARQLDIDYVEVREAHSFDVRVWPQLLSLVRDRGFDLIHGHDYKTNLLALLLARRTGAVPLATSHGWTGHTWRERRLYYPADRRIMRRMPRVIAVSSDVRQALIQSGTPPEKVTVLLNGIEPGAFTRDTTRREAVRRELGILATDRLIGAVGRLEPQKRFDLLIQAVAALKASHPDVKLAIVGDGSLRASLEAQAARAGVSPDTRFLGHRTDIAALHDAFDVFAQSSEYEGTPNAVLEAMAMETPIVATDAGGTGELALPGVHGLIVPAGDVEALRSVLANVLDDRAGATMRARAARRRIEQELSFAERTRKLEEIYDQLVKEHRARAGVVTHTSVGVPGA